MDKLKVISSIYIKDFENEVEEMLDEINKVTEECQVVYCTNTILTLQGMRVTEYTAFIHYWISDTDNIQCLAYGELE